MEVLKPIAMALACLGILLGVFLLLAAWFAPRMLATPFMRWMTTGRRLTPTRDNQTLIAIWSILLGTYILLSVSGHAILSLSVFVVWLPFGVVVIKRTFWPNSRA